MITSKPVSASTESFEAWKQLPWKKCQKVIVRLQRRIVKAVQEGRWGKVKALQHLLTRSFSGKALAVKRVTENQKDSHGNRYIAEMVRPESLRSYCLKGEEFLQKETERILKLIKPDVLPSESTHQCESGNRLVPSDADNEPPLEKEDAQS